MQIVANDINVEVERAQAQALATGATGMIGHVVFGGAPLAALHRSFPGTVLPAFSAELAKQRDNRPDRTFYILNMAYTQSDDELILTVTAAAGQAGSHLQATVEYWTRWEISSGQPILVRFSSTQGGA